MSATDPISDMLTSIRNAMGAGLPETTVRYSRMKSEIIRVLQREGFISSFEVKGDGALKSVAIKLKYFGDREPALRGLRRKSKPGLRQYVAARDVPRVLGGMGVAVLSTSSGIMSDREARQARIGGELLCEAW